MDTYIFFELALILVVTKFLSILSAKIHLPQVVGALVAGIILGPAVFGMVERSEIIAILAEIGVVLLMFSAGLETDLQELRKALKASIIIAVIGAIVPLGGAFALALAFGIDPIESMFIGVIFTATSISITVDVLHEMGKLQTKTGTAILGAAVIDDILGIILLSLIMGAGETGSISVLDTGLLLGKILIFFVIVWVAGTIMFKLISYLSEKNLRLRRISIISLAFCFIMAYLADILSISSIAGAYFAGLSLCSSKAERYIEERSAVLSFLFFSPIFFVSVGLHATFDGLTFNTVLLAFLLLIMAIITKFIGCGLGAKICGFTNRECLQVGSGMVSRGEVAIIIATKGIVIGLLNTRLFSAIIIVVILTTLITPLLLKIAYSDKQKKKSTSGT